MQSESGLLAMTKQKAILLYILLILGLVLALLPFYWMIITSLKSPVEAVEFPPSWIPKDIIWQNYPEALKVAPFGRYFFNTIIIAIFTLTGVLITSSLAAFSFSFIKFRGREFTFLAFLAMMMVPLPVYIIPGYLILARFGWLNSYLALIIPWTVNIFSIFLLRQHFKSIPVEIFESAMIDGCSPFQFLIRIAIPMVKPALVTITIFSLIGSWNSFIWPLVMTTSDNIRPVQVGLAYFIQEQSTDYTLLSAASILVVIPIIVLFFVFQRRIINSYMRSGIKG